MPEPNRNEKHSKVAHALPRHPKQRSPFLRFSILVLFLTAMVALVIGVKTVLTNQTKVDPPSNGKPRESTVRTILPENDQPPKTQETPKQESIPSLPVSDPEQPVIVDPAPVLPEGMEPAVPGEAANDALEKFLAAKTLEERMPMMETRTPATELEKSCLAGVLPPTLSMLNDGQETNAIEQVVDIYFSVEFDAGNNQTNAQTILVRTRGTGEPKIVADPFLDSFGGRLAAYAKTPSNKAGTFQVIISPVASCNDEKVPNREKKLTLKLLPRDNTKEIARAYFGRQSKIGSMLEDGTYSLSYGKARACTVMLRWNAEDNPQAPYLEALNLKSLDWNP